MLDTEFARRLGEAARRSLEFARTLVVDQVPDEYRFDVSIKPHGPSHDGPSVDPALKDLWQRGQLGKTREMTAEQVVGELCLGERVPEWIDISLHSVDFPREDRWRPVSFIELWCSRDLVDDDGLWYANEGVPPFHILGPAIPTGWTDQPGRKFFLAPRKKSNRR